MENITVLTQVASVCAKFPASVILAVYLLRNHKSPKIVAMMLPANISIWT